MQEALLKFKLLNVNAFHWIIFLHPDGTIRIGGRLANSKYKFDKKHPMLLDVKHPLTTLIFEYYRVKLLHAGAILANF